MCAPRPGSLSGTVAAGTWAAHGAVTLGRAEHAESKRDLLVGAAVALLLRSGVGGVTSRAVAEIAGVSRSNVHYWFPDMGTLLDEAVGRLTEDVLSVVAQAVQPGPEGFWRLLAAMGQAFESPAMLLVSLQYWAQLAQAGRVDVIRTHQDRIVEFFTERLDAAGAVDSRRRARVLVAWMAGEAFLRLAEPLPDTQTEATVAAIVGLEPPRR